MTDKQKVVTIDLPKAHSAVQRQIMEAFIDPEGPQETYIACGTKFGKTLACSAAIGAVLPTKPKTQWRWIAPYYSQSQIGFDNIRQILPTPYIKARRSNMRIEMPMIGSHIDFIHAQNALQIEGHQIHGYVFDEGSKIHEDIFYSARTTVTKTRSIGMGRFVVPSTPLGRNHFFKLCEEAKDEMEMAKLNNRRPTKVFITAATVDNPFISKQVIAEAKKALPLRLFQQYYEAIFLQESTTFGNIEDCLYGPEFELKKGAMSLWLDENAGEKFVAIGADWARGRKNTDDETVFTAIDYEETPVKVVGFMKLKGMNYTEQISQLVKFSRLFGEATIIEHDKTGVGIAIDDQLAMTNLVYRGRSFNNHTKPEIVCTLITAFEQAKLRIPRCSNLTEQLDDFEMTLSDNGTMKFAAAQGCHDDFVTSLMLAYNAARRYAGSDFDLLDMQDDDLEKTTMQSYYDKIVDDDEENSLDGWIETIRMVSK